MKKHITLVLAVVAILCTTAVSYAQNARMPAVPVDSAVRIGRLDNGLTYYIRHNEYPKGLADFFIAQKVGSVLEEDNQRGLAHFLEHMCFNGTKNFPDSTLLNWAESVGVKFGQNLNAYTSTDETVYYLSKVPVERTGVQDSCLLILHDWADALTLDPKEIDKERGVIHEEWRSRNVGMQRINETIMPVIYPGSRYAHRMPIGTMEVVDNFPYQALRDYYEKWYRPDLQGIVVVGDIDPDRIEAQIKKLFSGIRLDENRAERVYYPVPDTPGTIFAIGKDKEIAQARIEIVYKHDAYPDSLKNTMDYYISQYVIDMASQMLNTRMSDMMTRPETPFTAAGSYYGNFAYSKTKDAFSVVGIGKGDSITPTLEAVYREVLRAAKGFTPSEYDRARAEYLSRLESAYNGRSTRTSNSLGFEYVRNFLDNEPIPGIEKEYSMMKFWAGQIPVEIINKVIPQMIGKDNRLVIAYLPDKDGYVIPDSAALKTIMAAVEAEDIVPYVDSVKTEPLIPNLPKPGKIVGESYDSLYNAEKWVLSNGATVLVKPTDFDDDQIVLVAAANGGTSALPDSETENIMYLPNAMAFSGLGEYGNSDLQKYMAGRQASVNLGLGAATRTISGNCVVKDLQTMMELLYMTFTAFNINESDFAAGQELNRGLLHNQEAMPMFHFQKAVSKNIYDSPRNQLLSLGVIDAADRQGILNIIHDQLADVQDFTFVFTGKINTDSLRRYVEQYIAPIPKGKSLAGVNEAEFSVKPGALTDISTFKMDTPQTYAAVILSGSIPYNARNSFVASMAGQVLTARLLKQIREDMGATYSVGAYCSLNRQGTVNAMLQTALPMKPETKDAVLAAIAAQLEDMAVNISDAELAKVKEFMLKSQTENERKNGPWAGAMSGYSLRPVDTFICAKETITGITPSDIKAFIKELLKQNNYKVIVLDPEM